MPRNRTPDDTEAAVLALWAEGIGGGRIAKRLGMPSTSTVYRVLKRHGIEPRDKGGPTRLTSPEQDEEIVNRYLSGELATELAREYGFKGPMSVLNRVRQAGKTSFPRGGRPTDLSQDQQTQIVQLRLSGHGYDRIALEMGIPRTAVARVLRASNLTCHTQTKPLSGKAFGAGGGYMLLRLAPDDPYFGMARQPHDVVLEHRYVMARHLGRPLERWETVHHINGDRADNRIENLQLRQGRHGNGVRYVCCDCGSQNVVPAPLGTPALLVIAD